MWNPEALKVWGEGLSGRTGMRNYRDLRPQWEWVVSVSTWRGRPERQWVLLQYSSAGGWETEREWPLSHALSYSRLHHRSSERNSSEAAVQKHLHSTLYSKCGFLSSVSKVWHQYWMSISVWSVVTVDWTAGFGNWPLWERCGSIRKGWWGTCLWLNYDSTRSSDTQCPSQTTPPTIHHHTHPTTDQIHYCAQVWGLYEFKSLMLTQVACFRSKIQ